MNKRILRAFVAMGALATACASWGCVADRPSRNGVFNENQYIRKDFLIRPGSGGTDPGWFMKATVVQASTPDPFANVLFNGQVANVGGAGGFGFFLPYVRWIVTSDKLQLVNMRELSSSANTATMTTGAPAAQATRDPEVVNAWPITNVDLKYEINLDGEITNFFQENEEADWQQRQWVKVNFDKNDMSDIAPMGAYAVSYMEACGDTNTSTTLVPGSFLVDETNNYMTWQVQITTQVNFSDQNCVDSYGGAGSLFTEIGRQDETMTLMYSFVRASSDSGIWDPSPVAEGGRACATDGSLSCPPTKYIPLTLQEKDPIQRKYGAWQGISWDRDPTTGLLAATANVTRLNPNKPGAGKGEGAGYTLYLAPGYPEQYEVAYCGYKPQDGVNNLAWQQAKGGDCGMPGSGGLVDQMNKAWELAGANIRMRVMHADDATTFGDHASTNPKVFGDVRYSMVRFITDMDTDNPFGAVTQPEADPRTGEIIVNDIDVQNENFIDAYATKLEFYLSTIGGDGPNQTNNPEAIVNNAFAYTPPNGTCTMATLGATVPLSLHGTGPAGTDNTIGGAVQTNQNAISTVFQKMQQYLHKPLTTYGYLGPQDFIPQEDTDFYSAFFKIIPYEIYRDPASNPYVIAEGGTGNYQSTSSSPLWNGQPQMAALANVASFNSFMSQIDHGVQMFDASGPNGPPIVENFSQQFQSLSKGLTDSRFALNRTNFDAPSDLYSYFDYLALDTRHCVVSATNTAPHWESLQEWMTNMVTGIFGATVFHEFGHSMGLRHNFMASIDRNNFPTYCTTQMTQGQPCPAANTKVSMYANSIMEYTTRAGDLFWAGGPPAGQPAIDVRWNGRQGFLPYDFGAFGWIYGNNRTKADIGPRGAPCTSGSCNVSGQINATTPWNDPVGFASGKEDPYLFCTDEHVQYSPFCQRFDFGSSPSEIIASELNQEEWFYKWTNFRLYHKYWDDSGYAAGRAAFYHDLLRFLSTWTFDWNPGNLPELFVKLGVAPPAGSNIPEQDYYGDLQNKFQNDISTANQLVAAFHLAMVEQASGERPFITSFDPFYGDVTQQGIIIDKNYAIQNFTTLYPADNYDQNQAAGAYLFAGIPLGSGYQSVTENVLSQFVGGQYDIFVYDLPLAVSNFAATTQNIYFAQGIGRASIRQWIGAVGLFGNGAAGIDPDPEFLAWASALAQQFGFGCDAAGNLCGPVGSDPSIVACTAQFCTWDPRQHQVDPADIYHADSFNEFRGPDDRRYAFAFIKDRNQYLLVDRDVNTATYVVVRNWNTDVTYEQDDGSGPAYQFELPMKYFLNAYNYYN